MTKLDLIEKIKAGKIKKISQIDRDFLLDDEILDLFFLKNLKPEEIEKYKDENYDEDDNDTFKKLKCLVYEDIIDNRGDLKTIDEYLKIIDELLRKKKISSNPINGEWFRELSDSDLKKDPSLEYFEDNEEEKLEEKEYRYDFYQRFKLMPYDKAKKEILRWYKDHFSVPGGVPLEWLIMEKVFFKDLREELRGDKAICEYAIMDDENNYFAFSDEIKKDENFIAKLAKKYPQLNELLKN